jgi:hypothetical protein
MDSEGTSLQVNDDFNGLNSQITYTATTTGNYFLGSAGYSSQTGSYRLSSRDITQRSTTDDFTANISTAGRVVAGAATSGTINSNGDRDWFRIALTAGSQYSFTASGRSLRDPNLYLRNASGQQVAFNDDSGGSLDSNISFTATTSGNYFLDVGSYRNVGTGTYSVRTRNLNSGDDFTSNTNTTGSISSANRGSASGEINSADDQDWFAINLNRGSTYEFNVTGNTLRDSTLSLRDENSAQLEFNDDFEGETNSRIQFTATRTGRYYLDVGAFGDGTGTYTVSSARQTVITDDYGRDTSTTGVVVVGDDITGNIESASDQDWFRVILAANRTYRFNLDGRSLGDPTLNLRSSTGSLLRQNDNGGEGSNALITYTTTTAGTYFLDASAVGDITGSYELSATDVTRNSTTRITGLRDSSIISNVNTALSDNVFTHSELRTLLTNVSQDGVNAAEFRDLGSISEQLSPYLSTANRGYLNYVFDALVNGSNANRWFTGGAAQRVNLGNLRAGSTSLHMTRLISKWFGGTDTPTNFAGGDSAAGASFLRFEYGQMTGPLFENGVSYSDVNQGQAGTCYVLAAYASLANSRSEVINNMFISNADRTFGVRFYGEDGNQHWVTVDRSAPVRLGTSRLALAGNASRGLGGEMWVTLAERAYAQANEIGIFGRTNTGNSYRYIEGGWENALTHVSGLSTTTYSAHYSSSNWTRANSLTNWNTFRGRAISAVRSGNSLWLGSFGNTTDSTGKRNLVSGHAFAITGYNALTGNFTVSNPWGAGGSSWRGVFEASWQDFYNVRGIVSWA